MGCPGTIITFTWFSESPLKFAYSAIISSLKVAVPKLFPIELSSVDSLPSNRLSIDSVSLEYRQIEEHKAELSGVSEAALLSTLTARPWKTYGNIHERNQYNATCNKYLMS